MRAILKWLSSRVVTLLAGSWTSGAESCEYLTRLRAVPVSEARADRRAA